MIRNLKVLGVAVMAVLALGAVLASAASAQTQGVFTSDGPWTGVAEERAGAPASANRLTAFGAFVQCPGSTYDIHKLESTTNPKELVPAKATGVTLTPTYKETTAGGAANCTGPFGWTATIDMNGCDYNFRLQQTTVAPPTDTYGALVDIKCPAGKEITVTLWTSGASHATSPFCILHVPEQLNLPGADIRDTTTGPPTTADITGPITGLTVKRTEQAADPSPILCKTETITNATFDIDATVTGGKNAEGGTTAVSLSDEL